MMWISSLILLVAWAGVWAILMGIAFGNDPYSSYRDQVTSLWFLKASVRHTKRRQEGEAKRFMLYALVESLIYVVILIATGLLIWLLVIIRVFIFPVLLICGAGFSVWYVYSDMNKGKESDE